jgi:hypothetical protein
MAETVTYKTSSPSGDLISFLAGIKQIWLDTGKKAVVYHRLNMVGGSYEGSDHPYGNEDNLPVCFNEYTFGMMYPLLKSQSYIEDYFVFTGQEHQIDLDKIRMEVFTNQPKGSLNRWFNHPFPQMTTDLSKKWLDIPKEEGSAYKDKIIINFTKRHRNYYIHYFFLKEHQDKILFAGLQGERDFFCKEFNLDIPLLQVDNFYELAKVINNCKFILANQSFVFQISESLKTPRILELFPMMPNIIPIGSDAYDYYHQDELHFYFNKLLNK